MKSLNKIFTGILCGALVATNVAVADDCSNLAYKQSHPERCKYAQNTDNSLLYIGGGAIAVGGIAALIGMAAGGNDGGSSSGGATATPYVRTVNPTMIIRNGTAPDFTAAELASITSRTDYTRNTTAYDNIQLAYSIARGYTGAGTKIAVFDTDINSKYSHGAAVTEITSEIATGANVEHHMIAYDTHDFISYAQIATIINNTDANVYNNSWNVAGITADQVVSQNQFNQVFTDAISNAATNKDAIFVWSAGNDYGAQSGMLSAMPRVMPELDGHFVNVVAWDIRTNALANYSNACGVTQNYCITAPGTIQTADNYAHVGTSFAAPVVSAAIAIIREAWPYLNATQITDILFTTAADLGDPGVDEIYGHGMLDLEAATRPVGELSVAISDTISQPLQPATVSPQIAHAIESANPTMASFDAYGRAFETKLSDNVVAINRGLGFERLRGDNNRAKMNIGNLELGLHNTNILNGTGFMAMSEETSTSYIAANQSFNIGSIELFARSEFGSSKPVASSESMISEFSNIYTASATLGLRGNEWSFSIGIPETIISGNMNLHMATGRATDGALVYQDYTIDMVTTPSVEYTANYKFLTAGFVDNPYGNNEFYIFAKTKLNF